MTYRVSLAPLRGRPSLLLDAEDAVLVGVEPCELRFRGSAAFRQADLAVLVRVQPGDRGRCVGLGILAGSSAVELLQRKRSVLVLVELTERCLALFYWLDLRAAIAFASAASISARSVNPSLLVSAATNALSTRDMNTVRLIG